MAERTHNALVIVGARQPYEVRQYPTKSPQDGEVLVKVLWTASSPVDLHRMDGGLLIDPPTRTGSSCAGVVVEAGPAVQHLKPGDRVFGQGRQEPAEFPHQEFVTGPAWTFGKVMREFPCNWYNCDTCLTSLRSYRYPKASQTRRQ